MTKYFLLIFSVLLFSCSNLYSEFDQDLNWYIKFFEKEYIPTIADYEAAYGVGAEGETEIQLEICQEKKWGKPENKNVSRCSKYMREVANNSTKSPSLYLRWLRLNFRDPFKVKVLKREIIKEQRNSVTYVPYEFIKTKFGNTSVLLRRTMAAEALIPSGRIQIIEIDGVPVEKLLNSFFEKNKGKISSTLDFVN